MLISLHKNATTTRATRLAIRQAHGTEAELKQRIGVGKVTIRKWRKRSTIEDGSHTPHRLPTTLNAGQEEIVVYLRTPLRLSLERCVGGGSRVHRAGDEPIRAGPTAASAGVTTACWSA